MGGQAEVWLGTSTAGVTPQDRLVGAFDVPKVEPGEMHLLHQMVEIPDDVPAGTYPLWVTVEESSTAERRGGSARSYEVVTVAAMPEQPSSRSSSRVTVGDSLALVALYNDTDGPNWVNNDNWLSGPVSTWYGVLVDGGRVTAIVLDRNQLSGPVPLELGQLSNLIRLGLSRNQLSGPVPPELGQLSNLIRLNLSNNQLSGPVPTGLSQLSNLTDLFLYGNQLSGPVPPELGQLSNLESLWLSENQLSGPIPTELSQLSNLTDLLVYGNQLSGLVPPELGQLSELFWLHLSDNQLSGPVPPGLGQLSNLIYLELGINELSGPVPLSFIEIPALRSFTFNMTDLCEPDNPAFQQWLSEIKYVQSTNVLCSGSEGPDLVPLNLAVSPTEGDPGSSATVTFTVANVGGEGAPATQTNVRLSTSATEVTTDDPLLATITTPALAAGAQTPEEVEVTIPADLFPGSYYVWVILDVTGTAGQSNEANDFAQTPFDVTGTPGTVSVRFYNIPFDRVVRTGLLGTTVSPARVCADGSASTRISLQGDGITAANVEALEVELGRGKPPTPRHTQRAGMGRGRRGGRRHLYASHHRRRRWREPRCHPQREPRWSLARDLPHRRLPRPRCHGTRAVGETENVRRDARRVAREWVMAGVPAVQG